MVAIFGVVDENLKPTSTSSTEDPKSKFMFKSLKLEQ